MLLVRRSHRGLVHTVTPDPVITRSAAVRTHRPVAGWTRAICPRVVRADCGTGGACYIIIPRIS
jgi:hypothetical protein